MKIPIFHSTPTWQLSGVNTWSVNLATAMAGDSDFEHIVLFTATPTSPVGELDKAGLSYAYLDLPSNHDRRDEWRALKNFLEANAPCIYITQYDFHRSAAVPTFSSDVKVCAVVHSDEECYYDLVKRIGYASDAIVAVSTYLEGQLTARFPDVSGRVKSIPSGVPNAPGRARRRDANERLELVFSNRLAQIQKRIFDVPVIAQKLSRSALDFRLRIAGAGPDEVELASRFDRLGCANKVEMLGRLSSERVLELLASADIFLLTSDFEGLPMSLLEAMSAGCVPVVYDIHSGVRDAIEDGVNGMFVSHGDTDAMAQTIIRLHKDRESLERMSMACVYTHHERFSSDLMAARYKALFLGMMSGKSPPPQRNSKVRKPRDLTFWHRGLRCMGDFCSSVATALPARNSIGHLML